jgi:hypothetical protein
LNLPRRLHLAGVLVLVLGWFAAALVFVAARRADDARADAFSPSEHYQLERLGGKAAARAVEFDRWFASLWHGERLARTLALLSLAVGGSCLYLAGLMGEATDGTPPHADRG